MAFKKDYSRALCTKRYTGQAASDPNLDPGQAASDT